MKGGSWVCRGVKVAVPRDAVWVLPLSLVRPLPTHPGDFTTKKAKDRKTAKVSVCGCYIWSQAYEKKN